MIYHLWLAKQCWTNFYFCLFLKIYFYLYLSVVCLHEYMCTPLSLFSLFLLLSLPPFLSSSLFLSLPLSPCVSTRVTMRQFKLSWPRKYCSLPICPTHSSFHNQPSLTQKKICQVSHCPSTVPLSVTKVQAFVYSTLSLASTHVPSVSLLSPHLLAACLVHVAVPSSLDHALPAPALPLFPISGLPQVATLWVTTHSLPATACYTVSMCGWPQANSDLSLTSPPDSGAQIIPAHLSLLSLIPFLFMHLCRTPLLPAWDLTDPLILPPQRCLSELS